MPAHTANEAIARLYGTLAWWADKFRKEPDWRGKFSPYSFLAYYAYVLPEYKKAFDGDVRQGAEATKGQTLTLTTRDYLRGDTWFYLHPEKVAGREVVTSSQLFPLDIVGTKEDIIRTIRAGLHKPTEAKPNDVLYRKPKGVTIVEIKPDGSLEYGDKKGFTVLRPKDYVDREAVAEEELILARVKIDLARAEENYTTHILPVFGELGHKMYQQAKDAYDNLMRLRRSAEIYEYIIVPYAQQQQANNQPLSISANDTQRKRMKLKLKLATALLKLKQQPRPLAGLGGLAGILAGPGLAGLGELTDSTRANVSASSVAIRAILERAKEERTYSATDMLGFDEVLRLYNPGISDDDIRAWVWFKRSIGVAMPGGWKKFYLRDTGTQGGLLTTTKATPILDNAWRTIATVPAGVVIGKPTKKSHEYRGITYRIFRSDDNAIRFVNELDVKESKAGFATSDEDLKRLVLAGSLFYAGGELLPYPLYAFGNMYDRQLQLDEDGPEITARYGAAVLERHAEVIKATRPRLLSVQNPDPRERMKVLAISEFAKNFKVLDLVEDAIPALEGMRETEKAKNQGDFSISLAVAFPMWLKTLPETDFREVKAEQMIRYYLDDRPLSKDLNDSQKQTIDMYAGLECEELFSRFLHTCLLYEDQQKFDFTWNRRYNAQASVPFHRVPVGFECSARFKSGLLQFTSAQREAVAFMETTGSGILAYDVGVGKTMSAIITMANAMYAGKCARPLVVVPNATYKKWIKEIIGFEDEKTGQFVPGVLSNTGITINDWYNLGADVPVAKQLNAGKMPALAARSITVVTYEGLSKIGLSNKALSIMAVEMDAILQQTGAEKSARGKEKKKQGAAEIVGGSNAGTICDLDLLGFDYLVVDEAHNFKNIFGQVPTDDEGKKRYKISGSESARGQKLFFLANYIQRRYGRNILLLTATPFTNSPLEIYSMLSLVGYETMVRMGLHNLEVFCETFVLQTLEYVNSYDNTVRLDAVVKSFNNRLVLQKLIFNHIAYKTGEEAGVVRPCKINLPRTTVVGADGRSQRLGPGKQTLTYLAMSEGQLANQDDIIYSLKNRDPKDVGAIMRALGQSLDNALSPHLKHGYGAPDDFRDYIEQSPKLQYVMECIASVKQWHEDRGQAVSGQVIYMNRGKDYFPLIREWLIEETGYKADVKHNGRKFSEVEIISSGLSNDKKEGIKDAFLAGVVKVLIGTATIREGIDLQTRGTVLYNCYPDWNPTDVKQLEGRIWRQGNEFGFVRVVMPLVQNSMDVFVFQKLEEKTSRVNDLWYRGDRGNVLDQESLDPQEVKFALFTDVTLLVDLEIARTVKDAERRVQIAQADLQAIASYSQNRRDYGSKKLRLVADLEHHLGPQLGNYDRRLSTLYTDESREKSFRESLAKWRITAEGLVASSDRNDIDLTDCVRHQIRLMESANIYGSSGYQGDIDGFRVVLSKVKKAEKSFLKDRGMNLADDPENVLAALVLEVDQLKEQVTYYKSDPTYRATVEADVKDKKTRLQITGATVSQRAEEFAQLNHLLGVKAGENSGTCDIPVPQAQRPAAAYTDNEKARKRLKLKLKLATALLKLKAQTA